jgi:hypothetical protein
MRNRQPVLKMLLRLTLIVILGACGAGAAAAPTAAPPTPAPANLTKDLAYTVPLQPDAQEWKLDVYAPLQPKDVPIVVVLHGGTPAQKEDSGIQGIAYDAAQLGAVVIVPSMSPASHADRFNANGGAGMREDTESAACAVRFARANASKYGGQSDEVIVIGHSGGGYHGLWQTLVGDEIGDVWDEYASAHGGPPKQVDCVSGADVSARADAFIGFAGAYTVFDAPQLADRPDLVAVLSPATYIGWNTGAILRLLPAEREALMPKYVTEHNEQLYQVLRAAGYDVTSTPVDSGHFISGAAREAIVKALKEISAR